MSYVTGFLIPVKDANREAYIQSARDSAAFFRKYGATEHVEAWGVATPDGEHTSFPMAVKREPGESVVFSWLRWPDKATADAAWAKMEADDEMSKLPMPFDGKRMMWGGFEVIFEAP